MYANRGKSNFVPIKANNGNRASFMTNDSIFSRASSNTLVSENRMPTNIDNHRKLTTMSTMSDMTSVSQMSHRTGLSVASQRTGITNASRATGMSNASAMTLASNVFRIVPRNQARAAPIQEDDDEPELTSVAPDWMNTGIEEDRCSEFTTVHHPTIMDPIFDRPTTYIVRTNIVPNETEQTQVRRPLIDITDKKDKRTLHELHAEADQIYQKQQTEKSLPVPKSLPLPKTQTKTNNTIKRNKQTHSIELQLSAMDIRESCWYIISYGMVVLSIIGMLACIFSKGYGWFIGAYYAIELFALYGFNTCFLLWAQVECLEFCAEFLVYFMVGADRTRFTGIPRNFHQRNIPFCFRQLLAFYHKEYFSVSA